jgi:hypothetical protein
MPRAKKETVQEETVKTETTKKSEETKQEAPAAFTIEQVQQMIAEAIKKHDAEKKQAEPTSSASDGMVTMFFQAEVNDANEIPLGPNAKYGYIIGKHANITIPKRDFMSDFRTTTVQYFLKERNLVVVDGLTDEERHIFGLDYRQGEYLEPAVYNRLIEMGDHVKDVYPALNRTWREMVAQKFAEAYENKTLKCSRECLMELNKISRQDYKDLPADDARRKGGFWGIIHQMNAKDETAEDEA